MVFGKRRGGSLQPLHSIRSLLPRREARAGSRSEIIPARPFHDGGYGSKGLLGISCHQRRRIVGRACRLGKRGFHMVRAGGFEPPLPEGTRIFIPATAFAAPRREKRRVCGLDHPFAIAGPVFSRPQAPPVWPLHLPPTRKGRGLGSGFPEGQGSPNLSGSTSRVSPGALDYPKSDASTCSATPAWGII